MDLTAPRADRRCYQVTLDASGQYTPDRERTPVEAVGLATVVSSLTTQGRHAPALDVDLPALLTAHAGAAVLWVPGLGEPGWRLARAALTRAGLGAPLPAPLRGLRRHPGVTARRRALADALGHRVDHGPWARVLARLGPDLRCGFAAALAATAAVAAGAPQAPDPVPADLLADPWPVPVPSSALLLPSTHHHHLYLDAALAWAEYARLLDALALAGLLEPGYVGASKARQATHLRLPWVRKVERDRPEDDSADPPVDAAADPDLEPAF